MTNEAKYQGINKDRRKENVILHQRNQCGTLTDKLLAFIATKFDTKTTC